MKKSPVWLALLCGLFILVPAALVAGFIISAPKALDELAPVAVPLFAQAVETEYTPSAKGQLAVEYSEINSVVGGTASGTVSSINLAQGSIVNPGTIIATIDGIGVVAYDPTTQGVIYRDACTAPAGSLEPAMVSVMTSVGVPVTDGQSFKNHVKAFQKVLGVPKPDGCFKTAYILPLPTSELEVGEVKMVLGQPTPASGSPWFSEAERISKAELQVAGFDAPEGTYTLVFQGQRTEVEFSEGQWQIDNESLAPFLGKAPKPGEHVVLDVQVVANQALTGVAVATSAVLVDEDGVTCVAVKSGESLSPVPVEVTGSTPSGATALSMNELLLGAEVLTNPAATNPKFSCS